MIDAVELYPPLGLIIQTPDLVLQPADEACAVRLSNAVMEHGIHDPSHSPFSSAWTDEEPLTVAQSVFTNLLPKRAEDVWMLKFVVHLQGDPIGVMDLRQDKECPSEVGTGSWLLKNMHGKGYGTQARAAVLKLAFEGMGATAAHTAAYAYNSASLGVTRKLGYVQVGSEALTVRGKEEQSYLFLLTKEQWKRNPVAQSLNHHIHWTGLDPVLNFFDKGTS